MAIAYKSQGAGVSTETSGAALSPLCPATVDAGDILIGHVYWEGTTTAPSTPSGWTLLSGPHVIQSTIGRTWVFGKIAAGTEDGAAVAFGSPAVTTQRGARIYSFSGRNAGTITQLVKGFAFISHATDPQMPTVTTTVAGNLAVALVAQNDNNTVGSATGESGGDWVEAVAEYTAALTPGLMLQIQTCTPTADPGTVSGGSAATTNDPCGVVAFEIAQDPVAYTLTLDPGSYAVTGQNASLLQGYMINAEPGSYSISGLAAFMNKGRQIAAMADAYAVTGQPATMLRTRLFNAEPGVYTVTGFLAILAKGRFIVAEAGSYTVTGFTASLLRGYVLVASAGSYAVTGFIAALQQGYSLAALAGDYAVTGLNASLLFGRQLAALLGVYSVTGADADLTEGGGAQQLEMNAEPGTYLLSGVDAALDKSAPVIPEPEAGHGGSTSQRRRRALRQSRLPGRPLTDFMTVKNITGRGLVVASLAGARGFGVHIGAAVVAGKGLYFPFITGTAQLTEEQLVDVAMMGWHKATRRGTVTATQSDVKVRGKGSLQYKIAGRHDDALRLLGVLDE